VGTTYFDGQKVEKDDSVLKKEKEEGRKNRIQKNLVAPVR